MEPGTNIAGVLKSFVDEIVELEEDRVRAADSRKDLKKELRKAKLPVAELLALSKAQPEDVEKIRDRDHASALLGIAVPTGQVAVAEVAIDPDQQKLAKDRVSVILSLDEEIAGYSEKIKDKYKDAKASGLMPGALRQVVEFKLDPTKQTRYEERSLTLDQYLEVVS